MLAEHPNSLSRRSNGTWDEPAAVNGACSATTPTVTYFRGSLHVFWSDRKRLHWTFSESRSTAGAEIVSWKEPSPLPWAATDMAPATAVLGDHLHLLWKEPCGQGLNWGVDPQDNRLFGLRWRDIGEQVAPLAQLVSVLGVLLYALARISIQAFYAQLGVSPETAGQSYLSTIIPVAVALGAFVIIAFLVVSVAMLLSDMEGGGKVIRWIGVHLYRLPPRSNPAIHSSNSEAVGVFFFSSFLLALMAATVLILVWQRIVHIGVRRRHQVWAVVLAPFVWVGVQSYVSGGRSYGVVVLALALAAIVVTGVLAHEYRSANRATSMGFLCTTLFAGFSFPPLSATPIAVHLINPQTGSPAAAPFQQGDCLLDLGESNGYVVLYDVPDQSVWRVPQTISILSQARAKHSCTEATRH